MSNEGTSSSSSGSSSGSSGTTSSSSGGSSGTTSSSSGTLPLPSGAVDICIGNEYRPMHGILKGTANDYAELREFETGIPENPARVIDKDGVACKTADDSAACTKDLAAAKDAGWQMRTDGGQIATSRYVVVTKGNAVKTELGALWNGALGPSTREQAAFAATRDGSFRITCDGQPNVSDEGTDAWAVRVRSGFACGEGTKEEEHILRVGRDGSVSVTQTRLVKAGEGVCSIGRKPAGLAPRSEDACTDPLGRFFAAAAHLEAASVFSFERLAGELASLGAPAELVRAAVASRVDEIRHARTTAALAKRFGASPELPEVAPPPARTVFEIALENAVEGCVRETYGALVAHWQAANAEDASVRRALAVIAVDETRHAELSVSVAAFLDGLLTPAEREAVEAARLQAIEELATELATSPDPEVVRLAGMPAAKDALALLTALDTTHLRAA